MSPRRYGFGLAVLALSAPLVQESGIAAQQVVLPDGSSCALYPGSCDLPANLRSPYTSPKGTELLTVRLPDGRMALVDVTPVEDEELRGGVRPLFGPGRQLLQGCADFPALARTGLHSKAELDRVTSITGRSVAELTRLGQPGVISTAGFLAAGENILAVIRKDNDVVAALGLTHPQLARPLFHLWNLIRTEVRLGRSSARSASIPAFRYNDQWVNLETGSSRGWQESLFDDEIIGNSQIWLGRDPTSTEQSFVSRQYPDLSATDREHVVQHLTRIHTGEMVAFYIQRYGFYEGHTSYRADPVALAFVLGLRTLEEIEAALPGQLPALLTWPAGSTNVGRQPVPSRR